MLVHRPRYDDWSLPKGKLLDGESFEEAATREVREETGLGCRIGVELPPSRYVDQHGVPKLVRYWSMESLDGLDLHPTDEVDEARWFTIAEARDVLTYDRDRAVLDAATAAEAPVYLVRHAKAGDRQAWPGDDLSRPLSKTGRRQAKALVRVLSGRMIERILSSPAHPVHGDGETARGAAGAPDRATRRVVGGSSARRHCSSCSTSSDPLRPSCVATET